MRSYYHDKGGCIGSYLNRIRSIEVLPRDDIISMFSQIQAARERAYEMHIKDKVPLNKLVGITRAYGSQQQEQLELLNVAASYENSEGDIAGQEKNRDRSLRDWYLGSYAAKPLADKSIDNLLQATILLNGSKNGILEYVRGRDKIRDEIYPNFYRLVAKIASWSRWSSEFADRIQAGNRGLMAAVAAFDPGTGNSPSTLVFNYVKGYIMGTQDRSRGINGCQNPSFVENMPFEADPDYSPLEHIPDGRPIEDIARFMSNRALESALRALAPEDERMIRLHYYEGLEPTEISPVLGIGVNAVKQRIGKALVRLRNSPGIREAFSGSRQTH